MLTGSEADEQLTGFDNRADTISGGAGSDALAGGQRQRRPTSTALRRRQRQRLRHRRHRPDRLRRGRHPQTVEFRNVDGDLLIRSTGRKRALSSMAAHRGNPAPGASRNSSSATTASCRWTMSGGCCCRRSRADGADIIDARVDTQTTVSGNGGDDLVRADNETTITFKAGDGIDIVDATATPEGSKLVFSDLASTDAVVRRLDIGGRTWRSPSRPPAISSASSGRLTARIFRRSSSPTASSGTGPNSSPRRWWRNRAPAPTSSSAPRWRMRLPAAPAMTTSRAAPATTSTRSRAATVATSSPTRRARTGSEFAATGRRT